MNKTNLLISRLRNMLSKRTDRPEDKHLGDGISPPVTVNELLEAFESQQREIERLTPFEQAFRHAWEMDTRFDKAGNPRQIRIVFKITTQTSESMQKAVQTLLSDFNANAAAQIR